MIKNLFKKKLSNEIQLNEQQNKDKIINIMALLIEASSIDGYIDEKETIRIIEIISKYFNSDINIIQRYYKEALSQKEENSSFYTFTSKINKEYNYNEKIQILEMLWEIILIDGEQHDFESNLMRRVSGLLYIKDIDSGKARKKVINTIKKIIRIRNLITNDLYC